MNRGIFQGASVYGPIKEACHSDGIWYGLGKAGAVGTISTVLRENGRAKLDFGNCWIEPNTDDAVIVYLNDKEIASASKETPSKIIEFDFKDGDVLKLEEVNNVIIFNDFEILYCI